jgi:hypothetical protein
LEKTILFSGFPLEFIRSQLDRVEFGFSHLADTAALLRGRSIR